jgi:hypothetical protein
VLFALGMPETAASETSQGEPARDEASGNDASLAAAE